MGRAVRGAAALLCVTLLGLLGQAVAKPNIVLILADDMEAGLVRHMPTVRRELVAKGVTLSRMYFNNPLCCPSRATMLTGKYGQNTEVFENSHKDFHEAGNTPNTFAVWLQSAGYDNGLVGKYLNGFPEPFGKSYVPPGWASFAAPTGHTGIYYNHELTINGVPTQYGTTPADYSTDVYRDKALDFIDKAARGTRPFMLWLSFAGPHSPHTPAERHQDLFPDLVTPRTPNFNEADVSDKPSHIRSNGLFPRSFIDGLDEHYRDRVRAMRSIDEAVGAVIGKLREKGRLDDTYVVFSADNGFHHGAHRAVRGKGLPYEEDLRMAFHVRGPGLARGVSYDFLASNADLAPTFAEWAGAAAPDDVDGRSMAGMMRGTAPAGGWRSAVPVTHLDNAGDRWPTWRGVRIKTDTRDEAYLEYPATGEKEFYDLLADPWQLANKYESLGPTRRATLADMTAELGACSGPTCRTLDKLR